MFWASCHFGLSASVGYLAYWLTWTILWEYIGLGGAMDVGYISLFSTVVAGLFAVSAHILQDYFLSWF